MIISKSKKAYKILQTTSLFNLLVNVSHFNLQGEALEQFNKAYLKALENTSFERINDTFSIKIHYDINDPIFSLIHSIFDRNRRKGRKSDPTWKEDISKGKVRINRKAFRPFPGTSSNMLFKQHYLFRNL